MVTNSFKTIVVLMMSLNISQSQWKLIDKSFTSGIILDANEWIFHQKCGDQQAIDLQVSKCTQNSQQMVSLNVNNEQIYKNILLKTNQVRIIMDVCQKQNYQTVYYDFPDSGGINTLPTFNINLQNSTTLMKINNQIDQNQLFQESQLCSSTQTYPFQVTTIVSEAYFIQDLSFEISLCFTNNNQNKIGIRNLLIYATYCDPTCKTCLPTNPNSCILCNDGILQIITDSNFQII